MIKFVIDTKAFGLKVDPNFNNDLEWDLKLYCDSDWAGDKENRKSVSGFVLFLCGALIMWRSKQQATVALSSAEAEFIAVGELAKEIVFVVQIFVHVRFH